MSEDPKPSPSKNPLASLVVGSMVHYVMLNEVHRPATVVHIWDRERVNGCSDLQVFTDGLADVDQWVRGENEVHLERVDDARHGIMGRTSVRYSETHEPGTWHWMEPAL